MKQLMIVVALIALLVTPAIADEGDIWLWKSHYFSLFGFNFPVALWENWLQKEIFVHADYEGKNGILYTSIQGKGSSTSTIEERQRQFYAGVCISTNLHIGQIALVSESAKKLKVKYDDWKNYGMALDIMFGDRDRFWTNLLGNPSDSDMVCSEAVVSLFEKNGITVSLRPYQESTPNDIYEWRTH